MPPQQVSHLAVAFILLGASFVIARSLLIPDTFGEIGRYRSAAIDSIVAQGVQYAGHQQCAICHAATNERRLAGRHNGVSCEVCHGAAATHVAAPMDVKPSAPRERALCPLCHSYDPARPTGFPQIDPVAHNPLTPCITCHEPHEPEPPSVPEECSACHGQIARQKAVSHHAALPCTTCHEAPEAHKTSPRQILPSKPDNRSFCAACHAPDASSSPRIPRVNVQSHGQGYVCWQCHYPHYPEAGGP